MKKLGIAFALILNLVSCTNDESKGKISDTTDYYGKWTLDRMFVGKLDFICGTPDDNLSWKETYILNTDGTFSKTKTENNITITAVGTFKISTLSNETQFELNYKESSPIVEGCYGKQTENLYINKDNLLANTWINCDGLGLIFKKE